MEFEDDITPPGGGAGPEDTISSDESPPAQSPHGATPSAVLPLEALPRCYKPWEKQGSDAVQGSLLEGQQQQDQKQQQQQQQPQAEQAPLSPAPLQQTPSVQPAREDQIQNAIAFLSHPKVRLLHPKATSIRVHSRASRSVHLFFHSERASGVLRSTLLKMLVVNPIPPLAILNCLGDLLLARVEACFSSKERLDRCRDRSGFPPGPEGSSSAC